MYLSQRVETEEIDITVPYIGDQLTRVQLQKAKSARRGDDVEANHQFLQIDPFVIAMWHTKQDFCQVSVFVCFYAMFSLYAHSLYSLG